MTDTPRVDAVLNKWVGKIDCGYLQSDALTLARELERENAALRAMSDKADTSTRKGPRYQTLIQNAARKAQS